MSQAAKYYEQSSNYLDVTLTNRQGNAITDAVVTVKIVDEYGNDVTGVSWPATMDHDGGGVYSVIIPGAAGMYRGKQYRAQVTGSSATAGDFYLEPVLDVRVQG